MRLTQLQCMHKVSTPTKTSLIALGVLLGLSGCGENNNATQQDKKTAVTPDMVGDTAAKS